MCIPDFSIKAMMVSWSELGTDQSVSIFLEKIMKICDDFFLNGGHQ
jgi:hypothetical protein